MTAARVTKRARILAYLEEHPGRTAYEICVALDARRPNGTVAGSVFQLLRDMERKAQVVASKEFRPQQGRHGEPVAAGSRRGRHHRLRHLLRPAAPSVTAHVTG